MSKSADRPSRNGTEVADKTQQVPPDEGKPWGRDEIIRDCYRRLTSARRLHRRSVCHNSQKSANCVSSAKLITNPEFSKFSAYYFEQFRGKFPINRNIGYELVNLLTLFARDKARIA